MSEQADANKVKRKVRIELYKPDDFKQVYSIGAIGGHSPYDFRIGFYNDMPLPAAKAGEEQVIQRRLETEIILSPLAAQELSRWLNQHLRDYEAMFGPIRKTPAKPEKEADTSPQDSSEIQGYI